jgi:hypothetical protein
MDFEELLKVMLTVERRVPDGLTVLLDLARTYKPVEFCTTDIEELHCLLRIEVFLTS